MAEYHNGRESEFVNPQDGASARTPPSTFTQQLFAPATQWWQAMQWTRTSPKSDRTRRLSLIISYAPDWILTLLLALLLALLDNSHGFRREFSLNDKSIQHTYAGDGRVPVWLLVVLAFVVPLVIQAVISLGIARSTWDFHASFLGLVLSHAITVTATTLLKITIGRPRPDLIDRCAPRPGAQDPVPYGLVNDSICSNPVDGHLVTDGFRSFPSGHASTAFAGLAFFSLYLAGKFHLYGGRKGYAAVQWLVFIPMIGAALIAVSRTMDYRHHATDVIAGGILGTIIAISSYFTYYPSLFHPQCHKPYSPRIPRSGPLHHRNNDDIDEDLPIHHVNGYEIARGDDVEAQDEAQRHRASKSSRGPP